ncbi:hypothetical protein [Salegentibacter chungangensis]|uniref:DUF4468 domain-containing protein n=1 Tax=Salegentibacter chungangensis TaxID=1335724 RepID=A0ABW3NSU0_9FLAO
MKKLILILFLIPLVSFAQDRNPSLKSNVLANNLGDFAMQKIDKVYHNEFSEKVGGKAYLFDDWQMCIIKTTYDNGYTFSIPCNYNLFSDRFEMKVDDELYYLRKDIVVEIRYGDRVFKPTPVTYNKDIKNYVEVLGTGEKFDLVKQYWLRVKDVQSTTSLGLYEKKVTVKDDRYFMDDENKLTEVPNSRRKIYEALGMSKEERKDFDGNIKKNEDLVKAL